MSKYYVAKSHTHGRGLFAARALKRAERIAPIEGVVVRRIIRSRSDSKKMMTWFGLGHNRWINPRNTPFKYLNHSCDPNSAIIGRKVLIARRDIKKGEELTVDYSMTDTDPFLAMMCRCGSRYCRKTITSIERIPPQAFKRHLPYIPRFFQQVYLRTHSIG